MASLGYIKILSQKHKKILPKSGQHNDEMDKFIKEEVYT
jgi:hypothetical protein